MEIQFKREEINLKHGLIEASYQANHDPKTAKAIEDLVAILGDFAGPQRLPNADALLHDKSLGFLALLQQRPDLTKLVIASSILGLSAIVSYKRKRIPGRPMAFHNSPNPLRKGEVA